MAKVERIAEASGFFLAVIGLAIFAVWSRSLFSVLYAAVGTLLLFISFLRWRKVGKLSEKERQELIRRQDEAMMKGNDDPNEIARWVP